MTSRERILNLLEGKPVDRSPAMPITMMWAADLIGTQYHDYATRAEIQAAGQIAAATQFAVQGALQKWMSGLIKVQSVVATSAESTLTVTVSYAPLSTGVSQVQTFVYGGPQ